MIEIEIYFKILNSAHIAESKPRTERVCFHCAVKEVLEGDGRAIVSPEITQPCCDPDSWYYCERCNAGIRSYG